MNEIQGQILEIINRRELQMIVHSCIYYRMGTSLWSDTEFDTKAKELVQLIKDHPQLFEQSKWVDSFRDWDATTGFHLPIEDPAITSLSQFLIDYENGTVARQQREFKAAESRGTNIPTTPTEPVRIEKNEPEKPVIVEEKQKPVITTPKKQEKPKSAVVQRKLF